MSTRALREHLAAGGSALLDLNARAKFRLSGSDRVRYLNGQVSSDIRKLGQHEARPACVMTAKGKMNGLIWVLAAGEALQIDVEEELRESLSMRLERYIIADDALLDDVTEEQGLAHLLGFAGLPEGGALPDGATGYRSRRFGAEGIDIIGPRDALALLARGEGAIFKFLQAASGAAAAGQSAGVFPVDTETAEVLRIECGIPLWGRELDENTIPVEAGLEKETIDYHKGCYIGQEIISRIKSIGRVNRNLCGFALSAPLEPGTRLLDGEKEAGVLTSVAWSDALEATIALGYLRRGTESTKLRGPGAVEAETRPLPFLAL